MAQKFCIKTVTPTEYREITACMVDARGERHYNPEYLTRENLFGGAHELFAAYDTSGAMMGFIGITHGAFDDEMTTMEMLNIRRDYTGRGVACTLIEHAGGLLRKRGARALKANVITEHAAVQRAVERLGLRPCGFLHGVKKGENLIPSICEKRSLAVYATPEPGERVGKIYVHTALRDAIGGIYAGLGLRPIISGEGLCADASVFNHDYDPHHDLLRVQFLKCGTDLAKELTRLIKPHAGASNFALNIYLNLRDPSAVYGANTLQNCGFNFCGLDPLGKYEHALFYRGNAKLAGIVKSEKLEEFCLKVGLL